MNFSVSRSRFTLIAILTFINLAFSSSVKAANVWSPSVSVERVQMLSNGNFVLHLPTSNSSCQGGGRIYHVYLGQNAVTEQGQKTLYATVLMSLSLKNPVSVRYDNVPGTSGGANSSACYIREIIMDT